MRVRKCEHEGMLAKIYDGAELSRRMRPSGPTPTPALEVKATRGIQTKRPAPEPP